MKWFSVTFLQSTPVYKSQLQILKARFTFKSIFNKALDLFISRVKSWSSLFWNQPVLINDLRVVLCFRTQQAGYSLGFEPMTNWVRVRRPTHCVASIENVHSRSTELSTLSTVSFILRNKCFEQVNIDYVQFLPNFLIIFSGTSCLHQCLTEMTLVYGVYLNNALAR